MPSDRHPISFIATADPDAAKTFYETTLGLRLIEASPFALVFMDGDSMLRIQIVKDLQPADYTAHGWQVDDIDGEIEALANKGVEFLIFDGLEQNDRGIWTTPNGAKIAWFKDPSGNTLSLTQFPRVMI